MKGKTFGRCFLKQNTVLGKWHYFNLTLVMFTLFVLKIGISDKFNLGNLLFEHFNFISFIFGK